MSDLTRFNYDRLDNGGITKYLAWATYVEADLIAHGLWDVVEVTTPSVNDPMAIWDDLRNVHCPKGFTASLSMCRVLNTMQKSPDQDMESWISSVRSRSNELRAAGGNVTEDDVLI
ncbi:hypothetical protein K435DRAFT_683270 [Dendrothele bispora CBS 962.96]|uniref:DUF4219 domain-containing protein n=1 Tax=Dendrothele bispora (strain CBS 962.96) TaxID=1314807 RepID=A0A4S8LCJ4_DENBC|nr:hypothetical protein K435DRAFT_683270 [Dendrothele bispora CBS 962.96]